MWSPQRLDVYSDPLLQPLRPQWNLESADAPTLPSSAVGKEGPLEGIIVWALGVAT